MRTGVLIAWGVLSLGGAAGAQAPIPFCGPDPAGSPAAAADAEQVPPALACDAPAWQALGAAVATFCAAHPEPDCPWLAEHFACTDLEGARARQIAPENEGDFSGSPSEYSSFLVGDRALCRLTADHLKRPTVRYIASNWVAPDRAEVGWAEITFESTAGWTVRSLKHRPALVSGLPLRRALLAGLAATCTGHDQAACTRARDFIAGNYQKALWFHVQHAVGWQALVFGGGAVCSNLALRRRPGGAWRTQWASSLSCD